MMPVSFRDLWQLDLITETSLIDSFSSRNLRNSNNSNPRLKGVDECFEL